MGFVFGFWLQYLSLYFLFIYANSLSSPISFLTRQNEAIDCTFFLSNFGPFLSQTPTALFPFLNYSLSFLIIIPISFYVTYPTSQIISFFLFFFLSPYLLFLGPKYPILSFDGKKKSHHFSLSTFNIIEVKILNYSREIIKK